MFPLFVFFAIAAAVASDGAGSSSSSSSTPSTPEPIKLTCDDAVDLLPAEVQGPVSDAILTGTNKAALEDFARHLDELADAAPGDMLRAAYQVVAHCVRARSDGLPPTPSGLTVASDPRATNLASPSYSAPPKRWGSYSLEGL